MNNRVYINKKTLDLKKSKVKSLKYKISINYCPRYSIVIETRGLAKVEVVEMFAVFGAFKKILLFVILAISYKLAVLSTLIIP